MTEEELTKSIKSKRAAINEELLTTAELRALQAEIQNFADEHIQGDSLFALRYRKFRHPERPRTLWSDSNGLYPRGGAEWIKPWIDIIDQYLTEKKIKARLEDDQLWVQTNLDKNDQHMFIGEKDASGGKKVHLIFGEGGDIRFDKNDEAPENVLKKVQSVLTTKDGKQIISTMEFLDSQVN